MSTDAQAKKIALLHPILRLPVTRLLERAAQAGYPLLLVHTYRDPAEQLRLFQQGRSFDREQGIWVVTDQARVVTKAQPGQSAHETLLLADGSPAALGIDVVPIDKQRKPIWDTPDHVWKAIYTIMGDCGLDPYGDEWGAYLKEDKGHAEEPGWKLKLEALGCRMPVIQPSMVAV